MTILCVPRALSFEMILSCLTISYVPKVISQTRYLPLAMILITLGPAMCLVLVEMAEAVGAVAVDAVVVSGVEVAVVEAAVAEIETLTEVRIDVLNLVMFC